MKTMKWLMMCMLAIGACCLSACGDDDESIRLLVVMTTNPSD